MSMQIAIFPYSINLRRSGEGVVMFLKYLQGVWAGLDLGEGSGGELLEGPTQTLQFA